MRRLFGKTVVHYENNILSYYLTGSRKEGYAITIRQTKEHEVRCAQCACVDRSTVGAMRLCNRLVRGMVFPEQLQEIMEDQA